VRFSKDVRSMVVRRAMLKAMYDQHPETFPEDTLKQLAYDGQNTLFALRALNIPSPKAFPIKIMDERPPPATRGDDGEAALKRPRRDESRPPRVKDELEITLTQVAEVDLSTIKAAITPAGTSAPVFAPDALRALDVKLRDYAAQRFLLVKDKFFDRNFGRVAPLPGGIEAWTGFNVSFRPIHNALALNLDIVTACMVQPIPVLDLLGHLLNRNPANHLTDAERIRLKGILRNLRVEGRPSGQKHKVYDLTRDGAADLRFNNRRNNNESQSVAEYYKRQHDITLRFPNLPCISASNRPNKPCWIPLELCSVVDAQRYLRQLTPQQVAAIGNLRLKPDKRRDDISNAVGAAGLANNPHLEAFGMHIQPRMMQADGRQLEPPVLQFGGGTMQPRDGQWNMNQQRMFAPAEIKSWAVVCFDHRVRDPMQVATALRDCCGRKGLVISSTSPVVIVEDTRSAPPEKLVERAIERLKKSEPAFIVWILDARKTSPLYAPIKKLCDTRIGVPTQCIVQPPKGFNDQYLTNVALKMNLKMRGVNWVLTDTVRKSMRALAGKPTMIFGLDVSHGAPGSRAPSIAAVVATMDPHASKYAVRARAQHRRQETILGLFDSEIATGGMLCELMNDFGNANKCGPQRIIVYRDGISESQFPSVGAAELQAFRKAFEFMGKKMGEPSFRPPITYIVAQKRNNVRFLPSQGGFNVQPGTIVDRDVTHPFFFDFYMVSHKGLLGTSRPVHYHVLHDENGFTADEIQHLTHSLCYNYGRCTRAVSTGTPSLSLQPLHNMLQPLHNMLQPLHNMLQPLHNMLQPLHNMLQPLHNMLQPLHNMLQPLHNMLQPLHNMLQPLHNMLQPLHNMLQPLHNMLQPLHNMLQPLHNVLQPLHNVLQPLHNVLQPLHNVLQPLHNVLQPLHNRLQPLHNVLQPLHNMLQPLHNMLQPLHNVLQPLHNMLQPLHNMLQPLHNMLQPLHNILQPLHNVLQPLHNVLQPLHNMLQPLHNMLQPLHNVLQPLHNMLQPLHNMLQPLHNVLQPLHNMLQPLHNVLQPLHNVLQPLHNMLQPLHNVLQPLHNMLQPLHNVLQPLHNMLQPLHNMLQPLHNMLQPLHNMLQPLHNMLQPLHNVLQPLHNMLQPLHNVLQPLHNMLQPLHNVLQPLHNVLQPLHNVLQPLHNVLQPLHNMLQPLHNMLQPLHNMLQPLHNMLQPLHNMLQPLHNMLQPLHNMLQPLHNMLQPLRNMLQPLHNMLQPLHNMLQPLRNM
ncbi:unnamed protein product, partial [Closterium sp. Yama58-4]